MDLSTEAIQNSISIVDPFPRCSDIVGKRKGKIIDMIWKTPFEETGYAICGIGLTRACEETEKDQGKDTKQPHCN